jgi:TonB-linked SusC/RagA family outer membrane protein
MIKKIILFGSLVLCGISFSYGQEVQKAQTLKKIILQGKVVGEDGKEPLPGVTVLVKGTHDGVSTDFDGSYKIPANVGDVLTISSIGYVTRELKVKDKNEVVVSLQSDIAKLKEITIVGYGVQKKRDVTGAIGAIKGKKLDMLSTSFDNALAGKIAGVQVMSSSGVPGSATSVTIRGISSLNANSNNPLIVIDGVPVYGTDRGNNTVNFQGNSSPGVSFGGVSNPLQNKAEFERNPLSMLNMNDIESIEVLKDAYATAIFGSRGAAGVILVTTKTGTMGKPRISISHSTTLSNPVSKPRILNAQQYSDFYNAYYNGNSFPTGAETNWLDRVSRTGITTDLSASIAAGTEKMKYYFSFSSSDQEAYIVGQDFNKQSARVNVDYKFSNKLKFGTNVSINFSDNNALNTQSIYRNAVLKAPNIAEKTALGTYYFGFAPNLRGTIDNPIAQANRDINYVRDSRTIGNFFLEFEPISWLTLKSEVGIDNFGSEAYSRLINRPNLLGGSATQTTNQNRKLVVNNTVTFVKSFDKHSINGVMGQSFETSREQGSSIWGNKFSSDEVLAIGRASERGIFSTIVQEWALFSAFGRLNYQYDQKYLAGVTYRIDGSSRFNKNNRYIGFPSFSLGWRASEESFMKNVSWVNDLKFRGSVGFTGIDGTSGYYGNQGQYSPEPNGLQYDGLPILQVKQPNNPNLKWEKTKSVDLGVDASLFNDRLGIQLDYYHKKITNMLYASAVPWFMGYDTQQQNIGDMENKGFELTFNTINFNTPNFKWTTDFNIARNTNKILKLNFVGKDFTGAELGYKYFAEGESAAQFFLFDWAGVNPLNGNPLWNYPDGSQSEVPPASLLTNPNQYRKPMGDALPDFFGGITNTFSYKNLELSTFFSFASGGQLYNGAKALLMTYSQRDASNLSTDVLDHWVSSGDITAVPKLNNASIINKGFSGIRDYTAGRDSDRFLEDASFIRLKNIKLSYTFPKELMKKYFISNLTLYVQGNNLLTFTKYSGQDPEVSAFGSSALSGGYDELTLPQAKSCSIGLNIGL